MKEHMENRVRKSIGDAVQKLTDISAVGEVAHAQRAGEPMPSTEKLKIFVEKRPANYFPGIFWINKF